MNKKLIILAILTLALIPSVLASNALIQFSGHVTNSAGVIQAGVIVNAEGGGSTQTATTDDQGYFSLLLSPTTPCAQTIDVKFSVGTTLVGNYPVIACGTAPQQVNHLTITNKLISPISLAYFRVEGDTHNGITRDIPGKWDVCYLSAFHGKYLGNSPWKGCGVTATSFVDMGMSVTDEGQNLASSETTNSGGSWKLWAINQGNSEVHCQATCIRFEKQTS